MEAFESEVNKRLDRIKDIVKTLTRVHHRREYTSGDVREGYNVVLRTELNRMMWEVDEYKSAVASFLGDVEGTAMLSHTRFPTFFPQQTGPTGTQSEECVLIYDANQTNEPTGVIRT